MSQNKTEIKSPKLNAVNDSVDLSRRRFAKAGLIASPILASLPGKSALAGNCTSLSGMMSGNLSAPEGGGGGCGGKIEHVFGLSPGYWRTVCENNHQFPLGYQVRDFLTAFGYGMNIIACPSELSEYTLLEVLWLKQKHCGSSTQDLINLTRHTISALFSSVTSDQYFIGPEQIIDIYNATIYGGTYFEPVTGIELKLADVVAMYEASYVDMGAVVITNNDTFIDCADYKYDDRDGKGHIYIKGVGDWRHVRYLQDGTKVNWRNR